ncbi:hypothetical protein [Aureimonas phyllosphaerae]|uniref:Vacuolar-type H+-ATPase catalytic subunit A/Vma1 n=1 Tax=Aureimonas phyllosphaerae TaxID=1166078 RepID=A0A7W6BWZ2_9HYPH|nr:hypothetical protein [Aureimonas phyllosphaerae]MBB3937925.1 vacuolar-type H+-ATPase catalytic subunit A/Vma1 [Aureimonas phyllosphaerae]MBB3961902.1 vacuolar-type H+-ATPase catalytic subunit A/Vma1 [Aureimonas phyllosphaerae]SFF54565.1 hypothetical protein SAMN05216566_12530 [Aureimonas phyllosphaerae]
MAEDVDWCARAAKLRRVEEAILSGEMVTEARFGADMTRFASASLADVTAALNEALRRCAESRGEKPRRTRYAIPARARPY